MTTAEADQLIATRALADYFEQVVAESSDAKRAANWVLGVVLAAVKAGGGTIEAPPIAPARVGTLIRMESDGTVSNTAARQLFALLIVNDAEPQALAEQEGLLKISDDGSLVAWIEEVFAAMPTEARRFMAGETKLQGVIVGAVMKKSKGAADPRRINQILSARVG